MRFSFLQTRGLFQNLNLQVSAKFWCQRLTDKHPQIGFVVAGHLQKMVAPEFTRNAPRRELVQLRCRGKFVLGQSFYSHRQI